MGQNLPIYTPHTLTSHIFTINPSPDGTGQTSPATLLHGFVSSLWLRVRSRTKAARPKQCAFHLKIKTSPQAKRHKPSLLFTFLTIFTSLAICTVFGVKKVFWVKKMFGSKKSFGSKKCLGSNKFLGQKSFLGQKKFLGQKSFWIQKVFGAKIEKK